MSVKDHFRERKDRKGFDKELYLVLIATFIDILSGLRNCLSEQISFTPQISVGDFVC